MWDDVLTNGFIQWLAPAGAPGSGRIYRDFNGLRKMDNELRSISSKVIFLIVPAKFHNGVAHSAHAGNVHLAFLEVVRLWE